jgi:hypothetical protein
VIAESDRQYRLNVLPAPAGAPSLDGMRALPITVAGIPIPDSTLAREATVPEYVRPNFCDYIRESRFES